MLLPILLSALAACSSRPPVDRGLSPQVADSFDWPLPAGFPAPLVPADNPMSAAKVELGERLFFDPGLSGNRTLACSGCHRPELAFTDGRARARGSTGELHPRSAMSLANVAYARTLTWADPTVDSLEAQMLTPMFGEHPVELGLAGREDELLARLAADREYPSLFASAFPGREVPTVAQVVKAIASYERTLFAGDSPYDRWLFFDEPLPPDVRQGMELFFSDRLACSECHESYTFSGPIVHADAPDAEPIFHNTGLYNLDGRGAYPAGNTGLHAHTGLAEDMGRFRAPTLRNVALTAPYMHDGSVAALGEVLDHYAAGGRNRGVGEIAGHNPLKSPLVGGFQLSVDERAALLAFLHALTDRGLADRSRESFANAPVPD